MRSLRLKWVPWSQRTVRFKVNMTITMVCIAIVIIDRLFHLLR
jgi:hypothetical protein